MTTTGISSPVPPVCSNGSSTSMEFFMASALAISCGRKILALIKEFTYLINGREQYLIQ